MLQLKLLQFLPSGYQRIKLFQCMSVSCDSLQSFGGNQLVTRVQIDSCVVEICVAAEVKHERIEQAINIRQATWNFGFNGRINTTSPH